MPQMKPMNWIILFNLMNTIILFMIIKNYFNKNNNFIENKKMNKNLNINNWKW